MLSRALSMLGLAGKPKRLQPEAFRALVKAQLVAAEPALVIADAGPLALVADPDHEQPFPIDLTTLYAAYERDPGRLDRLVGLYTSATLQVLLSGSPPLSFEMLVPLLRTVEEARALPTCIQEPINDHLVAVYAIDLPGEIALVEESHLLLLGIEADAIAAHAAATMDALIDAASIEAEDGVIAITAEGGNASSFAFSVSLWEQPGFAGMPAIAVVAPERDLLLAFDPADEVAAQNVMAIAADVLAQSQAPLSLARMYVKGGPPEVVVAPPPPTPERVAPRTVSQRPLTAPAPPAATIPVRAARAFSDEVGTGSSSEHATRQHARAPTLAPIAPTAPISTLPVRASLEPVQPAAAAPVVTEAPRASGSAIRQLAAGMRRTS